MEEDEDECPHGLDPAWCSFCIRKAAGEPPPGVRRPRVPAAPKARARPPATGVRTGSSGATLRGASAPAPRGPVEALVALRKVLFHVTAFQAWPCIEELGLLPAAEVLDGDPRLRAARTEDIAVAHPSGREILVREQRSMARANMETHLDGIGLDEWFELVNERVFLFARQRELTTYLSRHREAGGIDLVVFDTARLLAAAKGRVEVTTVCPTAPVPWEHCRCRDRDTFEAIETFKGDVADIEEVTIVGGINDVRRLVVRVMRYHPDGKTEVVLG